MGKDLCWRGLTIGEFRTWLGLYFAMGLAQKPSISAYWERNKITSTPGFGQTMPRERFGSILRFLHFVDNNSAPPREEDRDRFFKIRPVIEELRHQFQLNYILSREISIDETMVKFKGGKFFRQFLLSKPINLVSNCLPWKNPNLDTSGTLKFILATKGRQRRIKRRRLLFAS